MSELKPLIAAMLNLQEFPKEFPPPGDFHSLNTTAFFGHDKCKEVYFNDPKRFKNDFRGVGKVAGLALVYGSMWTLFMGIIPNCTEQMAKDTYNAFFKNLPVFSRYDKEVLKSARKTGFIKTFIQRVIYIDLLHSDNWGLKSKGERAVKNYPIQGSGSDIIKLMLIKIFKFIKENDCSRWVGSMPYEDWYTRVLTVPLSQATTELEETLDAQPNGNCLVCVVDDKGEVISTLDKPIVMTQQIVDKFNLTVVL